MIRMLKQKFSGLLVVLLLLLAASFFFFSDQMPTREGRGNAQLLTLGGKKYTIKEFQSAMRDTSVLLTIQTGQRLRDNPELERLLPVMAVQRLMLDTQARRCGLDANLDQVTRFITRHPFFLHQGSYDPSSFRQFEASVLLPQGIDTERLGSLVAQHLRVQELLDLAATGIVIDPRDVDREIARQYGSCRMAVIPFSLGDSGPLPEPAEDALRAYHQTHAQLYQTEETRSVRCAVFHLDKTQAALAGEERQAALAALQQKCFDFATPFFEAAQGGTPAPDFAQAARAAGAEVLPDKSLTRETTGLDALPESGRLVQAAFSLVTPGQISEAASFASGVAVLQLIEAKPSAPRPFEEVRQEVTADYRSQEQRLQLRQRATQARESLRAALAANTPLEQAAKNLQLPLQEMPAFIPADNPQLSGPYADAAAYWAARLEPGQISELHPVENGAALLILRERKTPDLPAGDPRRQQTLESLRDQYARRLQNEWMRSLMNAPDNRIPQDLFSAR
jgi:peptidyl-prolyl cis-trans isomerase D